MAHTTKTMLCTPIYSKDGCVLGVLQFLNKREGFDCFSKEARGSLPLLPLPPSKLVPFISTG